MTDLSDSLSLSVASVSGQPSVASDTYQRAAKLFLTKSFVDALSTLQPLLQNTGELRRCGQLSDNTWIKAWKLYFVLLDAAAKQHEADENLASSWPKSTRRALMTRITDGSVWREVEVEFGGSLTQAPPDIVHGLVSLTVRRSLEADELARVSGSVENYLSSAADTPFNEHQLREYMKVLDAYVLRILPTQKEFEYAREVVELSPFYDSNSKQIMLDRIKDVQINQEEDEKEKKAQEQKRLKEEQQRLNGQMKAPDEGPNEAVCQEDGPIKDRRKQQRLKEGRVKSSSGSRDVSPEMFPRREVTPRIDGTPWLVNYWKSRVVSLLQTTSFWQAFGFLIIVLFTVGSPATRQRVKRIVDRIWTKLVESVRMGLKVSFV
jgi:hypothetical protein